MRLVFILIIALISNVTTAQYSSEDVAKALKEGDNTLISKYLDSGHDIDAPFTEGEHTLLCFAVKTNNAITVQYLIKKGAKINQQSNGKTPLMYGAKYGSKESVVILLEMGADPAEKNSKGRTAADYARKYQQQDMYELLKQE